MAEWRQTTFTTNRRKPMSEQWPESYLKVFNAFVADPRSERYAAALFDHYLDTQMRTPEPEVWKIIDVCCGTGFIGRSLETHLKSLGDSVEMTFMDRSKKILEEIEVGPTDTVICADVTSVPEVLSGSYDVVICRYGFNNLPIEDWLRALGEVLRILKPGGLFILQDHFVPGPTFSALVNEAEQFLAKMEGKQAVPFIFSTEVFNAVLDAHPLVESRVKNGYGLFVNIWDRLLAKKEILPDFEAAKREILRFYKETCLGKYKVLIVDPEEYIHVYNVTYAIVKRI